MARPGKTAEGTRQRILRAAFHVMQTKGLTKTTTREIARAARVADGMVFYHFKNRVDLLLQVLTSSVPNLRDSVMQLPLLVGEGTVAGNLSELLQTIFEFHQVVAPLVSALMAEPELLKQYRDALATMRAGPQTLELAISAYLRAEQRLRRVSPHADPQIFAALMIATSFQHAHESAFFARTERAPGAWARDAVNALMAGMLPRVQPRAKSRPRPSV